VSPVPTPQLDDRNAAAVLAALQHRVPAYLPGWQPQPGGTGQAVLQIAARYAEVLHERLNAVPDKHLLAFLDLLGLNLVGARAARAPIVFAFAPPAPATLPLPAAAGNAIPALAALGVPALAPPPTPMPEPPLQLRVPAATQVAANDPGGGPPLVFETEEAISLAGAKLTQVVSLWPGRDTYGDHSEALAAAQPFALFQSTQTTPHVIYLAHDGYFALTGTAKVEIAFDLLTTASAPLHTAWDYWDGQGWHPFGDPDLRPSTNPPAEEPDAADTGTAAFAAVQDGTRGLTRGGIVTLRGDCLETKPTTVAGIEANWLRARLTTPLPPDLSRRDPIVRTIRVNTVIEHLFHPDDPAGLDAVVDFQQLLGDLGLPPDKALADTGELDLSKAFYPFGPTTQPGSVFYFASEEIFAKAGAEVRAAFVVTVGPLGDPSQTGEIPELAFEYWDGRTWRAVTASVLQINDFDARAAGLTVTDFGTLSRSVIASRLAGAGWNPAEDSPPGEGKWGVVLGWVIPDGGVAPGTVNGKDGRWMRARIVRGSFTRSRSIDVPNSEDLTIVEHLPPLLAGFRFAYASRTPRVFPERTFDFNDFVYTDRTAAVRSPGPGFAPFHAVADVTPALYLGFDGALPADTVSIYLALREREGAPPGPPLTWEYSDGFAWREVFVRDETARLVRPGMIAFIGAADAAGLARFDSARHWLRARLREDGEPVPTVVEGIFANAVWALHAQTLRDEVVGSGNGEPNQSFFLLRRPVLDGEIIEVRELDGPRAAVELPILQREVPATDLTVVPDVQGRPREVWVRWHPQRHLYASGPDDRHYVLEHAGGRIVFGGRPVPAGAANVRARQYRTGGGAIGNVPAGAIAQLLGGIPYVSGITNPRAAEGGADGETAPEVRERGPQTLRHRDRAMAASDYESLAREASPGVAIARALPATHPSGRHAAGWVTLIVVPEGQESEPRPSFELRRQVQDFVLARAASDLTGLAVIVPTYLHIGVTCTVAPVDMRQAGPVGVAVRKALEGFLHPVSGGPEGGGWPFGRAIHISDVAALIEAVAGVDYVQELELLLEGIPQGETVAVPPDRIVVAGQIRVQLRAGEDER
jgi:hypothetical protein